MNRSILFRSSLVVILIVATLSSAWSLTPRHGALFVRVVDVGAGECCVIKLPNGQNIVYDAGNYEDGGRTAFAAVQRLIPVNEAIDLLILSHSDSDHLAATKAICDNYKVKQIIHPGVERETRTWRQAKGAIQREARQDDCSVWNLKSRRLSPGTTFSFGDVQATLVSGFHLPPKRWNLRENSERMNAGSIVLRLEFKGRSILFCGDAVGRHIGDPDAACIASENFMVRNSVQVPISAEVIVAPHHGADNGSSTAFIQKVRPKYVIFSSGHKFQHPRKTSVERYLRSAVDVDDIFRTDRGDDEGAKEWSGGRIRGNRDEVGDDDVDVLIRSGGQLVVAYSTP